MTEPTLPSDNVTFDWVADPVIEWPANASLTGIIAQLQTLNPTLKLQRTVGLIESSKREIDLENDDDLPEYLTYDGTSLDVFGIAMPEPAEDELMSGLTRVNRERWKIKTPIGHLQYGPHRTERTAAGDLLVRPRSWHVDCEASRFGFEYQWQDYPFDQIGRIQSRWGVFQSTGSEELWEVEYAYLPAGHFYHADGRRKTDREWWETTPIGTIAHIDEYDLPLETHIGRARAILAKGSDFAIIADLRRLEYRIYRLEGVRIETEPFVLPEMPWFSLPKLRPRETEMMKA